MSRPLILAAVALPLLAAANDMRDDPLFVARFESFRDAGYDPLTTPVDWYRPVAVIRGGGPVPQPLAAVPPAGRSVSTAALEAAAAYAGQQNSSALIVLRDGKLQFERYWQGNGRESYFNPQSMSKTLLAIVVGIAAAEGHIGIDDPVGRHISEWRDDPRGEITLRQLLQMSGGLAQLSTSYAITLDNPAVFQHFGTDFTAPILALPQADPPGTRWDYNNNESNLLGVVVERATGERYAGYVSKRLWQPLGLADAKLYLDRDGGTPMFSCCVLSRPLDWALLGQLLLNDGRHGARQIVPGAWVDAMRTPSSANPGYGFQLWLGDYALSPERPATENPNQPWSSTAFADPDTYSFRGFGYQRVWIMPSKRLVIVRAGRDWAPHWDNSVIPNTIYRGTTAD